MRAFYQIPKRKGEVHIEQVEPKAATVLHLWVHPKERGNGLGRELLQWVCEDADEEHVVLWLEPSPFSFHDTDHDVVYPPTLSPEQLRRFYRSFGFRMKPKPFHNTMTRQPRRR